MSSATAPTNTHDLQAYYRSHACFYDATRWSFLFGRKRMINALPHLPPEARILEAGCGTGTNLALLNNRYPYAQIIGMDLSRPMLERAAQKIGSHSNIKLRHKTYPFPATKSKSYNLILLSYSLTMMGKNMEQVVAKARQNLSAGGILAVVDFHKTPSRKFQQWMKFNNTAIDGAALPLLDKYFQPVATSIYKAYFGLWSYFIFLGNQAN